MRLTNFTLRNLGPIGEVELALDPHFNAFAGINGAGKTTLLSGLATMLARYSAVVRTGRAAGNFSRDRIRRGKRFVRATCTAEAEDFAPLDGVFWSVGIAKPGIIRPNSPLTKSDALIDYASRVSEAIQSDPEHANLPIVVLYSVNRAVLEVPLRIRGKVPIGQYAALEDALAQGPRNFRNFFTWFRDREDVENESRAEGSKKRDPQLKAVRKAVAAMLPGFDDLRVRRQPLRMLITKGEVDLRVDELSDGEKTLLAMVGDLARRLAIANPGRKDPLQGSAIVLVDEIELHLHPGWQRSVVKQLRATFPNCQFIVTTHSAQVLSEVQPQGIFLLKDGMVERVAHSYGRDSNLILEELMGSSARPVWAREAIRDLYELIDDEDMGAARERFDSLEEALGFDDPILSKARSLLKRRAIRL